MQILDEAATYRRALEVLEAYEPRALIYGTYGAGSSCCAAGAIMDMRLGGFYDRNGAELNRRAMQMLIEVNDAAGRAEDPADRYECVVTWLRQQVGA